MFGTEMAQHPASSTCLISVSYTPLTRTMLAIPRPSAMRIRRAQLGLRHHRMLVVKNDIIHAGKCNDLKNILTGELHVRSDKLFAAVEQIPERYLTLHLCFCSPFIFRLFIYFLLPVRKQESSIVQYGTRKRPVYALKYSASSRSFRRSASLPSTAVFTIWHGFLPSFTRKDSSITERFRRKKAASE